MDLFGRFIHIVQRERILQQPRQYEFIAEYTCGECWYNNGINLITRERDAKRMCVWRCATEQYDVLLLLILWSNEIIFTFTQIASRRWRLIQLEVVSAICASDVLNTLSFPLRFCSRYIDFCVCRQIHFKYLSCNDA